MILWQYYIRTLRSWESHTHVSSSQKESHNSSERVWRETQKETFVLVALNHFRNIFYMIYIINKYVFILLYTYILHSLLRWCTFFWTSLCGLCRCRRYISVWRPADDKPWLSSTRVEALLFTYYSLKSDLLYISTVFLCMYSYIIYSPDPIRSQRTSGCFPWKSGIEASV